MESKYQDITHGLLAPLIHWASCHNGDSGLDVSADMKRVKYECFEEEKKIKVCALYKLRRFIVFIIRQTACGMQVTLWIKLQSCSH